jgi:hypothetical protein
MRKLFSICQLVIGAKHELRRRGFGYDIALRQPKPWPSPPLTIDALGGAGELDEPVPRTACPATFSAQRSVDRSLLGCGGLGRRGTGKLVRLRGSAFVPISHGWWRLPVGDRLTGMGAAIQ